jgi:hypothetical protein
MSANSEDQMRQLVDNIYDGDATAAILAIASRYGVALAYFDRGYFEANLERALTEPEWDSLKDEIEGFDEWLSNSGAAESIDYWQQMVLTNARIEESA